MQECRNLWAAVLEQAITDLNHKDSGIRKSANYWFTRKRDQGIGSFVWLCNTLQLDPENAKRLIFSNRIARQLPH